MANYANMDRRRAELVQHMRETRIAEQIKSMGVEYFRGAFWLFCIHCARRKLTDVRWVTQHIRGDEVFGDMRRRMPCLGCGLIGQLVVIPAPDTLDNMRATIRKWELEDLVLRPRELSLPRPR